MSQIHLPFFQYAQCTHSSMEEVWHLVNNKLVEIDIKSKGPINKSESGYFSVSGDSKTSISYIKYGQKLGFDCTLDNALYLQFYCVGQGLSTINGHSNNKHHRTNIFLPQEHIHVQLDDNTEQIVLRIDAHFLQSLLQEKPNLNQLRSSVSFMRGIQSACTQLIFEMQQLKPLESSSHILDRFYQRFIDLSICNLTTAQCYPNHCSKTTSHALSLQPKKTTPVITELVRYIDKSADQPYSLDDLLLISGMSARNLYYLFQKELGTTPYKLHKHFGLQKVREALLSSEGTTKSITEHATDWGFMHVSRFSAIYKSTFGELPSTTLNKRKQLINALDNTKKILTPSL